MPKTLEKPSSTMRKVINPATEAVIAEVKDMSAKDVDQAVQKAKAAFEGWSRKSPGERAACLFKLAQLLEDNAADLAAL
ncbi:MAG: aldehyde dehydrogenase family protein, partial [Elusimicrobia bacterium]|nr:aldehyde dehydrogenase family protein [Elusimicrobiota bacterium]